MIATIFFALMHGGNAGNCVWSEQAGSYGPGYAKEQQIINGVVTTYQLAEAQRRCLAAPGCQAVTCPIKDNENAFKCTLRASSQLIKSPSNEISWVSSGWTGPHAGVYAPGYPKGVANGGYSLAEAKKQCLAAPGCKAVTCQKKESECTLRASSELRKSAACSEQGPNYACDETSYLTPSEAVARGKTKKCLPVPCVRTWNEAAGFSAHGYASWSPGEVAPTYQLAEAQRRCLAMSDCKAVTCEVSSNKCTLRSSTNLAKSGACTHWDPCKEITYIPTTFTKHVDRYAPGVIAGYGEGYPNIKEGWLLAEAQRRCFFWPGCEAVTCNQENKKCTLRASNQLKDSPVRIAYLSISYIQTHCMPDQ